MYLRPPLLKKKNEVYITEIKKLGAEVLRKALKKQKWEANSLDYIITVSCTGIMIPSLDAYIINEVGCRQDIVRLPVTEMGCVAGISGMIYASRFLRSHPGKRAAVIAVESPTATFQLNDFSMANMVSAAIFGDGAACVLLSSEEDEAGPEIIGEEMFHFPDTTHLMGFEHYKWRIKNDARSRSAGYNRYLFSKNYSSFSGKVSNQHRKGRSSDISPRRKEDCANR